MAKAGRLALAAATIGTVLNMTSGTAHAASFCNTTPIIGSTGSPAPQLSDPYPSAITVSGLTGTITDVNVRLLDINTRPDNNPEHWMEDADMLLSAPNNSANLVIASDIGGDNSISSGPVVHANVTLDDQAANPLPADTHLDSGTYRPLDDDDDVDQQYPTLPETDLWPAPAPTASNATTLAVFNGLNPNGTWNLWIYDDMGQAAVDISGGWCLDIVTTGGGPAPRKAPADFDGDGDTDISVFRPSNGVWYTASPASSVVFGESGDIPVPGDYDGDGNTDQAVYRPSTGVWYLNTNTPTAVRFGESNDIPVPADYNGDGKADIAVFRPSTGVWYIQNPASSTVFGQSGDIPVPADYNGDGKAEIAVFRPSTGVWYISGPPASSPVFGTSGDIPVPGDYDGDGKADVAVFRPSTGVWYIGGTTPAAVPFGASGDLPQPGDYNADGKTDIGVFRPSTGVWYIQNPASSTVFGSSNDIPLPLPYAIRRFFVT